MLIMYIQSWNQGSTSFPETRHSFVTFKVIPSMKYHKSEDVVDYLRTLSVSQKFPYVLSFLFWSDYCSRVG